jgi:hypothetical protein
VAIGITGIMLPALATAFITSLSARPSSTNQLQATGLLHEADEALRSIREADYASITTDGTYHPVLSGSAWTLASGIEQIGDFQRKIELSSVQRDSNGAIVNSGTVDPSTRHAVITISWTKPYASSVSSDLYLTRWLANTAWTQTAQADFNSGVLTDTVTTSVSGGEIQLAPNGPDFMPSGTFESSIFDAGKTVGMQRLSFGGSTPGGSSLQLQIAANDDNATWNYVGPDGTAGTYFTGGAAIPLAAASGRYVRYKVLFTAGSSNTITPVLSDVTVTYAP